MDDEIPLQGGSHASSSNETSLEPTTKRREDLGKHNGYTHFPKDRNCEICERTKITRAPCRRRNGEVVLRVVNFGGDLITADHKVLSDNCESRNNHRYAVVVQDLATQWIQPYPCKNKTSQETQRSSQKFLEPERKPKVIYTDNSLEFGKACEDLSWNHCTVQYGKLRSDRGSWFINEFFLNLVYLTPMTPSRQEIDHSKSSSGLSTSTPVTPSKEIDHSDHPPAIMSSESVDRQVRSHPYSATDHHPAIVSSESVDRQVRGDPYFSDITEWLQEFRENLVDDRVPERRDSHASSSHESCLEPTPARSVDLGKHSVYTHFPKDRNCEICQRTKITRAPCTRRVGRVVPRAENIGDWITVDHKVLSEGCESRNNHRYAVVVQDLATQWIQSYPCKTKTSQETGRSLQKFLEPNRKPKVIYIDKPNKKPKVIYTYNSLEFGKACEDLSGNHGTSTPHWSETNGIAERAVRRAKEGTSAVLLQSGLNESWWADSMECYTYLRNVTDLLSDGKTPYERRFGQPFKGPIIPFGSLVENRPITAKDQSRIHQFGKKVLPGLFLGYALYAGGVWKGDVLVADLEELETMDASEIYSKRLNAKEVIFPRENGKFIFPAADRRIKLSGGDQELRTPTLVRHRPIQGESNIDFLGESEGSLPQPHDSLPVAGEALNDFWSMSGSFIYRHHVEPRVKLYSPREESFPIPLKYIDVTRTTHTNLDVKLEKRIDDHWNIDGSRDLSDPWTGFTQFTLFEEKVPDKRRISLEEQKAQKDDRFLRGRQIAYLIYDHFRVTGSHDSL